jgi:uroporphyrinogen decarboxylase
MIFDTWGGMLSDAAYHEFSLAYIKQILGSLKRENEGRRVPSIVFTKGGGGWLESIADTGCDAVGLDWTINISAAKARVGARVALQGNMDPAVLLSSPEAVQREAVAILKQFGSGSGHVFNLGHGISQFTPPEHVSALIEAVRGFGARND